MHNLYILISCFICQIATIGYDAYNCNITVYHMVIEEKIYKNKGIEIDGVEHRKYKKINTHIEYQIYYIDIADKQICEMHEYGDKKALDGRSYTTYNNTCAYINGRYKQYGGIIEDIFDIIVTIICVCFIYIYMYPLLIDS